MNDSSEQIFKTSLSKIDFELAQYYKSPESTQAILVHGRKEIELPISKTNFPKILSDYQNQIPNKIKKIEKDISHT